ncbi:MAG: helix-turn-helix domain-containing protein [Lachnospiraceae bacterium]|nr:helix-turn-helix domain-containing protein [Lachnospiraceae bacterium]
MYFDMTEYGKRVKKLRESKGLSQEKLSNELGMSVHHLSNIERGNRVGTIEVIIMLADYFDVSLDYLLRGRSGTETGDETREQLKTAIGLLEEIQKKIC